MGGSALNPFRKHLFEGNRWEKLARSMKLTPGTTIVPKGDKNQRQTGLRLDYERTEKKNGVEYNKFQLQPNAGNDIPAEVKRLREKVGGTHAVLGIAMVKVDGDKDDVEKAMDDLQKDVTEKFG
jgi:hypothetical protein